ncbi:hypothetical protein [Rhizobium leguminosarum]|uniref:hypothetical protein n=1 Tax=Rhizobium leguminosarum TaxID=384 RepID=UPI00103D1A15|nr:hypothetical protein [Rhizobium leguminosarum]TCA65215.1 hypothetical protein E0H69_35855 [Rhizobium leguminosarum bv. viciae]
MLNKIVSAAQAVAIIRSGDAVAFPASSTSTSRCFVALRACSSSRPGHSVWRGWHSNVPEIAAHRLTVHSNQVAQKILKSEYGTAPVRPVSLASIANWAGDFAESDDLAFREAPRRWWW